MGAALCMTDAGQVYLKPMAADVNPHGLAVEFLCSQLAERFGLKVPQYCILNLTAVDEVPRPVKVPNAGPARFATPGPAFASQALTALTWDGTREQLLKVVNRSDLARLVVFDTWIRNVDRYPPVDGTGTRQVEWKPNLKNILLVREPKDAHFLTLYAIDFGHALVGGRELPERAFGINKDQEELVYGLFPEFRTLITSESVEAAAAKLREMTPEVLEVVLNSLPTEWQVSTSAKGNVRDHLSSRARFLADRIKDRLAPFCYPQGTLEAEGSP